MNFVVDEEQNYQSNNPESDMSYQNAIRMSKNGTLNPNKMQEHHKNANLMLSIHQNATTVATSQMQTVNRKGHREPFDMNNESNFQEIIEEEKSGNMNPNVISYSYYKGVHPAEMICSSRESIVMNPLTDVMVSSILVWAIS